MNTTEEAQENFLILLLDQEQVKANRFRKTCQRKKNLSKTKTPTKKKKMMMMVIIMRKTSLCLEEQKPTCQEVKNAG